MTSILSLACDYFLHEMLNHRKVPLYIWLVNKPHTPCSLFSTTRKTSLWLVGCFCDSLLPRLEVPVPSKVIILSESTCLTRKSPKTGDPPSLLSSWLTRQIWPWLSELPSPMASYFWLTCWIWPHSVNCRVWCRTFLSLMQWFAGYRIIPKSKSDKFGVNSPSHMNLWRVICAMRYPCMWLWST